MIKLALLLIFLLPVSAYAETKIIGVGDSIYNDAVPAMVLSPPENSSIVITGNESNYDGATLGKWMLGRGAGTCDETALYGCLENNEPFDIIWIYGLGINDWHGWFLGTYADMDAYLDTFRTFYQNLHADFPNAIILHTTGYVYRKDIVGRAGCTWGRGTLTPNYEPTCTDLQTCIEEANSNIRGFNELIMAANSDLSYVHYHDTFEMLAEFSDSDNWFDSFIPVVPETDDCIHMPEASYTRWYGRFISRWFTNYFSPNVVITNTVIENTSIN
jgi:hypothetical protein